VIGLGYVGLPLTAAFAGAGYKVLGVDVDAERVKAVNAGRSHTADLPDSVLAPLVKEGRLRASTDFRFLRTADAVVICVPTPLRKTKDPDLSYIIGAAERFAPFLRRGQVVVLESTTYPGTTRELLKPILEKGGLKAGRDFALAFSPERVDPGNKKFGIRNTPKVVGGLTPSCARAAAALYGPIVDRVVTVSTPEAAEMVKLLENTFRAVNIALVNEVALMCDKLKINTWEVIDAAATKPFGFMPFYPGPGIGGHCIPLDPAYLSWKLKTLNYTPRFISLAEEINSHMPEYVVSKLAEALNERGKAVKGARILILGMAYKKDVADVRESPALDLLHIFRGQGAHVTYHDPHVPRVEALVGLVRSRPLSERFVRAQDAVVLATDHSVLDIPGLVRWSRLFMDTRNAARGVASPRLVRL
jgi:UDP-N-acetyl-D-glucosamine dehydrogenase